MVKYRLFSKRQNFNFKFFANTVWIGSAINKVSTMPGKAIVVGVAATMLWVSV